MSQPLIVQAEYSFKGGNNDELCFKKGDLITVTQREEGGWWEGTLNDKTGWFPSNYVNEYKAPLPLTETIRPPEEIQEYRSVVLKDLLDSERAHVAEVQGLLENFLEPLQQAQILTADEYAQLMCNFVEVVKTHDELLKQMEECNDRVGKLFLTKAPHMKLVHQAYCAAHPKAIVILDKHKDELEKYMERQGAASPGLLVLTTGLSKPFRRLDKYSAMLQELERHMESSHPDRGDTQRSVAVYKDIAAACSATRRQKELELQVLTGPVRGWQGQELSTLGDIIHMGSVAVGPDHRDRYFVLFPQTLLILSVSQRMSAFIYEGKLPLTGIIVNRLEDSDTVKNAFEINGPLIERIVAVCQGPNEANRWVELLTSANPTMPIGIKRQLSNLSNKSMSGSSSGHAPQPPPHNPHILDARGYSTRFSLCAYYAAPPCKPYRITLPPSNYPPTAPYANLSAHFAKLVKTGRLKSTLVKMLLYPQARQSIDLKRIPLRRKRSLKSSVKMYKSNHQDMDYSNSSERSELERQDAFELPTDSESDEDEDYEKYSDHDSSALEYVKFHANRRDSIDETASVNSVELTRRKERHCSSINLIKLDTDSMEDSGQRSVGPVALQKESLIIGSKAMQALVRKSTDSVIIHTTTAHLDLCSSGGITSCVEELSEDTTSLQQSLHHQASQTSHGSSVFCERFGGAYVACENLAKMSDETKIKLVAQVSDSPPERHSMPNLFVGNRFNRSSNTAVYVPTWQDRKDAHNLSVDALKHQSLESDNARSDYDYGGHDDDDDDDDDGDEDDVTHSSTLDLPAECLTAPDKMQAELLYNFDESCLGRQTMAEDFDDIISPPSMFKPQFLFNQSAPSSQERDRAVEKKNQPDKEAALHNSQSTTELYIEPQRASGGSDNSKENRPVSVRRCISYQYVQMSNAHVNHTPVTHSSPITSESSGSSNGNPSNNNNHLDGNIPVAHTHRHQQQLRKQRNESSSSKCKCCESSQCPSPRSSDSGMAGSCTITSPDPPHGNYYVGEDLPMSETSNSDPNDISDLTRFDVCGMFRAKFLTPEATQDLIDNTDSIEPFHHIQQPNVSTSTTASIKGAPISTITTAELQISASSTTINSVASSSSHQMMTNSQANMQFSSCLDNIDSPATAGAADGPLFRSGLYAHWWKKEKLPTAVVRGIAKALQSSQLSKESRCSRCSSCASCVSGGGSGFSEGTAYSSLCRECVCFCRSNSGGENSTNTTTTTSMVQCPLCSADDGGITDNNASSATQSERASRSSFVNAGAVTATTSSTSTVSSPSSSLDCPICKGLITRGDSLSSLQMADDDGAKLAAEGDAGDPSSSHLNCANCSDSVVEDVSTRQPRHAGGAAHKLPKLSGAGNVNGGHVPVASVTTQTEPVVQSPPQLQSIHAHSASTTSSSSSTTTTKSTKSSGGTKPQIKFSPDIEQFFKEPVPSSSGGKHKRKDRKHKS
ncbi:PREDICTED: serine-rich adhesin for platelets isoform X1 [Bactrocera latifrons]|nr:PREDICTED: serine-rich adhesin for platelets isoform X1 [Bactrocera latifrons]XP_018783949.1 PREDICTED: serine-rich adhesin for platelets isoform X1 [Bactrocera latifrons]